MRIAVIGGGVSGLGAAWALRATHQVTLFERETRLGGHANTVQVEYAGARVAVDTGFVVFNEHNYPHFTRLLAHLGVATRASDMSFSVSDPDGFEWSSGGLTGMFAWKRNLARPAFLAMLADIVRFNAAARADLLADRITSTATLGEYLGGLRMSEGFVRHYLLPMGAAIWSTPEDQMLAYPAASFLRFFDNHRLLHYSRPTWRTIVGGSAAYVGRMRAALAGHVRLGEPVLAVERFQDRVRVRTARHEGEFDQVIFACHSDEALALLGPGEDPERRALASIGYAPNLAYLHRDAALMPTRRAAWASWNYLRRGATGEGACVSYWMNRLHGLDEARPIFVTLNPPAPPAPALTFARFRYDHPQFDKTAIAAQGVILAHQGANRTWFAGAWLGHGFHEDGLASALAVAQCLGARPPWPTATRPRDRRAPVLLPGAIPAPAGL